MHLEKFSRRSDRGKRRSPKNNSDFEEFSTFWSIEKTAKSEKEFELSRFSDLERRKFFKVHKIVWTWKNSRRSDRKKTTKSEKEFEF